MDPLRETKLGKMVLVWFPEEILELQMELTKYHHDLIIKMADVYPATIETQLAKLCLELDILVDGDYEVDKMCKMLVGKLKERRRTTTILIPGGDIK